MRHPTESGFDRRDFIGALAAVGAGTLLTNCGRSYPRTEFRDAAPAGPVLKAGLIGCGGRGTGAAQNFVKAGPNLQITALADVFEDRLEKCRKTLADKSNQAIDDSRCFLGFDAFKKLLATDVDIVLHATPPHFRPEHFDAAVEAKKHVFMEKPVAVDPTGVRLVLAAAQKAKAYGLTVVTGTQRRHQRDYLETYSRVANGAIGKIVAARCYWNQSQLWSRPRQKGWSDMEAMLRDWVNWCWLSGDHIVEQHVHNLDVITWFTGSYPVKAMGMGGRMRRPTGDQYDFFAVDYTMDNGIHVQSTCRQIDGCANNISEFLLGTKGSTNCRNRIFDRTGNVVWQYQETATTAVKEGEAKGAVAIEKEDLKSRMSAYDQEHIDLVTAIRTNQPINEAENMAKSTLMAILGRASAYTGGDITWDEIFQSPLRLGPAEYSMGDYKLPATPPVAGRDRLT